MAILTVSLFLPYTVHFDIGADGRGKAAPDNGAVLDDASTGSNQLHAPKPINVPGDGRGLIGSVRRPSSSLLAGSPPASTSPITSGFKTSNVQATVSSSNLVSSTATSNKTSVISGANAAVGDAQNVTAGSDESTNEDFFYKNPLRQSLNNLSSMAPLGETEVDVLKHPGKSYVLRKNQSFSYIQPRSRAETESPKLNTTVVEGRLPSLLGRRNVLGLQKPSSKDLLKVASRNVAYRNAEEPVQPTLTSKRSAKFNLEEDSDSEEKIVPYGGYSNPNIGQNILNNDSIFETAPWEITDYGKGNGGLRNAVNFALEEKKIKDVKWIGTVGMATDALSDKVKQDIHNKLRDQYNSVAVFAGDFMFQGHYKDFCKQILWPTLHYQVPDEAKSDAFENHSWEHYRKLNEVFADQIVKVYQKDDVIWIHDYHLLLLPEMLRQRLGPQAKIGFFLHTAFPSSEVFRCLAQRKQLLLGMLGANSIGFQIPEYCRHFLQTCNRILLADVVSNDGLLYDGKYIDVYSTPVGIDVNKLAKQIEDPSVDQWKKLIRQRWAGKQLIVNRDKLDRLRGVKQKLLAYERFLKQHPEFINKAILVQICLKSTSADTNLESEIMRIVERINSLATDFTVSQPVVFLNQDIDFQQYLALLSNADTFIVSTMREGMNLTCHEFVVATKLNKPPLILSEFTGSAYIFQEGVLLINPWNINQIANQIYAALTMPTVEKEKRWNKLYLVLEDKNCYKWIEHSLGQIQVAYERQQNRSKTRSIQLNNSEFVKIYKDLKARNAQGKRLFILDFDSVDGSDKLSSSLMLNRKFQVISELTADPHNVVIVMSYMKKSALELMYGRISNVGLIAENGGYIKIPKLNRNWISLFVDHELAWMDTAKEVIASMVERLPGSYLEVEECTIRFHTEKCDDRERAAASISDCISHVNEMFEDENVHATAIKDTVVIQQIDLPLKALGLILNFYEKGEINFNKLRILSPPSTVASSPISQPDSELFPPVPLPSASELDLLIYISVSNPITEPIFEYCNDVGKQNRIKHVFTAAAGQVGDTSANSRVDGMNKLLTILSSI